MKAVTKNILLFIILLIIAIFLIILYFTIIGKIGSEFLESLWGLAE